MIKETFVGKPQIVQIGDCLPLQSGHGKGNNLVFFRVVSLKCKRDTKFMQRVLDITDPQIASEVLPGEVEVSELSFNAQAGYLVHADHLQEVSLVEQEEERLICPPPCLPRYTLSNYGKLVTLLEPYFGRAFASMR